jgi:hypothetical protein
MPALHLNDAGTWRQIRNVYVNDAGTWRTIQNIYVNDAGTWRQVYQAAVVFLTATSAGGTSFSPTNATVTYSLRNTGSISRVFNGNLSTIGQWIDPTSAANGGTPYECRATLLSGTSPSGDSLSTWLAMTADRSWFLSRTSVGTTTCQLTVEIRRASDGVVLTSQTVTITAIKE